MVTEVVDVAVDTPNVTYHNSFNVTVQATDCDYVWVIINGVLFQLVTAGQDYWTTRIHAHMVGEYAGTFKAYCLDSSTNTLDDATGPALDITINTPMMPLDYMKSLFESELGYSWLGRGLQILTERDAKKVDTINFTCVILKEVKRVRRNRSRLQYKDVTFPVIMQVYHTDSDTECQRLFEALLAIEEKYVNLPNGLTDSGYDYIRIKDEGKTIAAYGAAAKGSTLINYTDVGLEFIDFVVDRNVHKQGKFMPGKHLPVSEPERLVRDMPDYVLMLAWNFADEIMKQQSAYREKGGRFIIPVPRVRVV